jgi:hypothetical protein
MARPAHEAGRRRSTTESTTPRQPSSRARGTVADRRGVDPPSPQTGDRLWKVGRDPLTGVGPAMEGTSGAAERALLRGRAGEAALSCESSRQRAPGRAGARASGQRGGFVAGGQTNSRRRRRLRAADRHEPTTGGVRADRVGAKRSPRAVAVDGVIQRRNTSSLRRPLTRETSTGRCHESGNRPSAARHSPKRRARGRSRKVLGPSGSTRRKLRALGSCRKSRARRVRGANSELDNREDSCTSGRPQVWCCGVRSPWSCSRIATVAEVDRRREATLAHARRARGQRGTV